MKTSELCSVEELHHLIDNKSVKILDGSWYLPSQNRDSKAEHRIQNIGGSSFFDIDTVCDPHTSLPHMLPDAAVFANAVSNLGINNSDSVIVYDSAGLFSAARVWWMFKVFGHNSVQVLNGGLPAWLKAGGKTHNTVKAIEPSNFTAHLSTNLVATKTLLMDNCESAEYLVLDARPKARFLGQAPEPRAGLPSGHMPRSLSLPIDQLIENGMLKSPHLLQTLFTNLGIDQSSKIITSCGSGVTAAIITLALSESGLGLNKLYDGAWAEWGAAKDTPVLSNSTI